MTTKIFIDTGAWYALADADDAWNIQARQIYQRLVQAGNQLITSNLVINESYTLLLRRLGHDEAIRFLKSIRKSRMLSLIYSDEEIETDAQSILERYSDQDFSYVDAVSFAVMQQRGINQAFTFDHHFLIAGFTLTNPSESS